MVYYIIAELSVAMAIISFIAQHGRTSALKLSMEKASKVNAHRVQRIKMQRATFQRDLTILKRQF